MRFYSFLFLCPLVDSVCYPDETIPECIKRMKEKDSEPKITDEREYEDDIVEARHSGLGKECFKLNCRIKFHFTQIGDLIKELK